MKYREKKVIIGTSGTTLEIDVYSSTVLGGVGKTCILINGTPFKIDEKYTKVFGNFYIPIQISEGFFMVIMDYKGEYNVLDSKSWSAERLKLMNQFTNPSKFLILLCIFRAVVVAICLSLVLCFFIYFNSGFITKTVIVVMAIVGIIAGIVHECYNKWLVKKTLSNI